MFCEDVRCESGGTETIVGVFPDNPRVPETHPVIPKYFAYVRVNVFLPYDIEQVLVRIHPEGQKPWAEAPVPEEILATQSTMLSVTRNR